MSDKSETFEFMYCSEEIVQESTPRTFIEEGLHITINPYGRNLAPGEVACAATLIISAEAARKGVLDLPRKINGLGGLAKLAASRGYLENNSVLSYAVPYEGERRGGL